MTMICIGNLSDQANAAQTRTLLEPYGVVLSMQLTPGGAGHRFDGFALVEMEFSAARRAITEMDGKVFQGAILSVREAAVPPTPESAASADSSTLVDGALAIMRRRYELAEVEKVKGPVGAAAEDDWYRYVLVRCTSRIIGFHRGSLTEVTEYASGCAEAFNERSLSWRSSYRSTFPMMASRKR